jgi:hypothetical protein
MSPAFKFARLAGIVVLCLSSLSLADAASGQPRHKAKKPALPPLPSGPTGPVPQIPLDSIAPVPPQVSYQDRQLTIVAPNSTLGDILRAVRKQTGAEIEIPDAKERVVTHLGPGPAREVIAELLNGSRFNYVLLGSPVDADALTRVVLVAKTGPDNAIAAGQPAQPGQPGTNPAARLVQPQDAADTNDADAAEENAEDNAEQTPAEAEQAAPQGDQPEVKTPQQLLQEMQQRQLQMQQQQQQQQGQPGPGIPPRPPQEQ